MDRFSIRQKMTGIVVTILLMAAAMGWFAANMVQSVQRIGIDSSTSAMMDGQKQKLQIATDAMAVSLGEIVAGVAGGDEKIALLRKAVDPIRFEEDASGYFFVYRGLVNVAFPTKKELQGKDLGHLKDKNGVFPIQELDRAAGKGGGFVEYVWPKPGAGDQPKLSYAVMIPGTDMWVGTGVYLDNVAARRAEITGAIDTVVQRKTLTMYAVSGSIFLFVVGLVVFISRGIVKPLHAISDGLMKGADEVASAASEVSSAGQSLAEGASEQAATVEESSASLEEIASMVRQNTANAGQADAFMKEAVATSEAAGQSMRALTEAMQDISGASEETRKIIKTIDEIAFQTNLLALNAAVEAARAGEAGAGFAVVADEVRNLAMRAAEAAKQTAELIDGTAQKTTDGTALVAKTNDAFDQMLTSARKVADLLTEVSEASKEQAQGIEQINKAVSEIDQVTQQNAANAEESAASSEELNAQAEQMKAYVKDLIRIVDGQKAGAASGTSGAMHAGGTAAAPRPRKKVQVPKAQRQAPKAEEVIPFDDEDTFEGF